MADKKSDGNTISVMCQYLKRGQIMSNKEKREGKVGEGCHLLVKVYPGLTLNSLDIVPEATWLILYIFNCRWYGSLLGGALPTKDRIKGFFY